jgi:hypothetical protein
MDFLNPIPTNMDDAHGNQNIHLFDFARCENNKNNIENLQEVLRVMPLDL